ncbi:hypothetical protein E6C50_10615 [Flavobacterium supellecticarium]|uniref:DUF5367 domain-containing protein n=1 Tax=Flavobacterium supellecticarium TaxID=2565924 RepID=A0A4S3ZVK6_9FLAO|nr:DUF5367 family protein [Flavobacterium supellecticarium]THF49803.1 hypothetical protein E6C50_10615 [Flavobacterium supellecticarium]
MKTLKENYPLLSFIVGFLVWLVATLLFRIAGQHFFIVDNTLVMIMLYIILIPALGFVATTVFNICKLDHLESIKSAAIMVLPGMLLDTVCVEFFEKLFPNMPEIYSKTFASWLMFAYAIVLIFGLLRKKLTNKNEF